MLIWSDSAGFLRFGYWLLGRIDWFGDRFLCDRLGLCRCRRLFLGRLFEFRRFATST